MLEMISLVINYHLEKYLDLNSKYFFYLNIYTELFFSTRLIKS